MSGKKIFIAIIGLVMCLVFPFPSMAGEHLVDQAQCRNVEELITVIRGMYNQTNRGPYVTEGNQVLRTRDDGSAVLRSAVVTGDPLVDPVMKTYGYQTYSLEFYYDNPDYDKSYVSGTNGPNFIYAVIDNREYRYYFQGNSMIRRIGPEGTVSDNPKTNEFLNLLYQAGCYYQKNPASYSSVRSLQQESIVFGPNYYVMQKDIVVQAGILESFEEGNGEYGIFTIDKNTQISNRIQEEVTWREGDNGYSWLKRYLETEPADGGYVVSLDCLRVNTTGNHVDVIEGIFASH
ncbi:hypothetical protein [Lacrimispora sp. 210928-DFI.3.58]|uniref:hypothetical protein n=1 Tax=Lacrimispora sp. 210928-DFI.3.58 TaxID=2883214 RepID=UPI001D05FC2B|nr:hypothetical protein [Lacrimispora sp. 210928-DFI.3.58]MCB7317804.1 hypothetical protein [Lacrimispora sp. 210928-DFI.3.58]